MTYENASEAKILKSYLRGQRELPNTVFVFLDPSGKPLTHGTRSPQRLFRNASEMGSYMNRVAGQYRGRGKPSGLPAVETVRLGLNVAACDDRPLAIVLGESKQVQKVLEDKLASQAWSDQYQGKVVYTAGTKDDLNGIRGVRINRGYLFVVPNDFGTEGKIITQLPASASSKDLESALRTTVSTRRQEKLEHHQHVRQGSRRGIAWQTQIPVTDRKALQAQRGRNSRVRANGNNRMRPTGNSRQFSRRGPAQEQGLRQPPRHQIRTY